jgi:hypothetical protein
LVLPDRILVTGGREDAGELSVVDPETGNVRQTVSFPMGLAATAAVDLNRGEAYVFGEHSSLYILALDSLKCRQVVHLGHTAGNMGMGPISVGDYLVAAENAGPDFCQLHVLMQDADRKWKPAVAPLRLDGQVVTPLVSEGRRLLVNTDLGAVHVFDLNNTNPSEPVREVARVH